MRSLKLSTAAVLAFGGVLATACANEDQTAYSAEPAAEVASSEAVTNPDAAAVGEGAMAATAASEASLVGQAVFDESGTQVGTVEKVVTDAAGVEVAVISAGTSLGIGAKSIAIPTSELTAKMDGTGLTAAMTADEMEAAPAYTESPTYAPPETPDPQQ